MKGPRDCPLHLRIMVCSCTFVPAYLKPSSCQRLLTEVQNWAKTCNPRPLGGCKIALTRLEKHASIDAHPFCPQSAVAVRCQLGQWVPERFSSREHAEDATSQPDLLAPRRHKLTSRRSGIEATTWRKAHMLIETKHP